MTHYHVSSFTTGPACLTCFAVCCKCCSALQCVACHTATRLDSLPVLHASSVLQCVAIYCSVSQCVAWHNTTRHVSLSDLHASPVLQCVKVCCSVSQFVEVCCSVLKCVIVLHGTATHCNTKRGGHTDRKRAHEREIEREIESQNARKRESER